MDGNKKKEISERLHKELQKRVELLKEEFDRVEAVLIRNYRIESDNEEIMGLQSLKDAKIRLLRIKFNFEAAFIIEEFTNRVQEVLNKDGSTSHKDVNIIDCGNKLDKEVEEGANAEKSKAVLSSLNDEANRTWKSQSTEKECDETERQSLRSKRLGKFRFRQDESGSGDLILERVVPNEDEDRDSNAPDKYKSQSQQKRNVKESSGEEQGSNAYESEPPKSRKRTRERKQTAKGESELNASDKDETRSSAKEPVQEKVREEERSNLQENELSNVRWSTRERKQSAREVDESSTSGKDENVFDTGTSLHKTSTEERGKNVQETELPQVRRSTRVRKQTEKARETTLGARAPRR